MFNFLNSAFQFYKSSFSDDLHNAEQRHQPDQHSQVTLFNKNYETKMGGYLKIGIHSAPVVSKVLTCEQHRMLPFPKN